MKNKAFFFPRAIVLFSFRRISRPYSIAYRVIHGGAPVRAARLEHRDEVNKSCMLDMLTTPDTAPPRVRAVVYGTIVDKKLLEYRSRPDMRSWMGIEPNMITDMLGTLHHAAATT